MTAISLRSAQISSIDRVLVRLGFALVRLGHARAERRARTIARERVLLAAGQRLESYERRMLDVIPARR